MSASRCGPLGHWVLALRSPPKTRSWLYWGVAEERADLRERPMHRRLAELVREAVQRHGRDVSDARHGNDTCCPGPGPGVLEPDVRLPAPVGDGPSIVDLPAAVSRTVDGRAPVATLAVTAPCAPRLIESPIDSGEEAGADLVEQRHVDSVPSMSSKSRLQFLRVPSWRRAQTPSTLCQLSARQAADGSHRPR